MFNSSRATWQWKRERERCMHTHPHTQRRKEINTSSDITNNITRQISHTIHLDHRVKILRLLTPQVKKNKAVKYYHIWLFKKAQNKKLVLQTRKCHFPHRKTFLSISTYCMQTKKRNVSAHRIPWLGFKYETTHPFCVSFPHENLRPNLKAKLLLSVNHFKHWLKLHTTLIP